MTLQNLLARFAALPADEQGVVLSAMRHALSVLEDEHAQDQEAQLNQLATITKDRLAALRHAA